MQLTYYCYTDRTDKNGVRSVSYDDSQNPENSWTRMYGTDGTEWVPGNEYRVPGRPLGTVYSFGTTKRQSELKKRLDTIRAENPNRVKPNEVYLASASYVAPLEPPSSELDVGKGIMLDCYLDTPEPYINVRCGKASGPFPGKQTTVGNLLINGIASLDELPEVLQDVIRDRAGESSS